MDDKDEIVKEWLSTGPMAQHSTLSQALFLLEHGYAIVDPEKGHWRRDGTTYDTVSALLHAAQRQQNLTEYWKTQAEYWKTQDTRSDGTILFYMILAFALFIMNIIQHAS